MYLHLSDSWFSWFIFKWVKKHLLMNSLPFMECNALVLILYILSPLLNFIVFVLRCVSNGFGLFFPECFCSLVWVSGFGHSSWTWTPFVLLTFGRQKLVFSMEDDFFFNICVSPPHPLPFWFLLKDWKESS